MDSNRFYTKKEFTTMAKSALSSEEGVRNVLRRAKESGVLVESTEEKVKRNVVNGNVHEASNIYLESGNPKKAIGLLVSNKCFPRAARIAINIGDTDLAKVQIRNCEKEGFFHAATSLWISVNHRSAVKCAERAEEAATRTNDPDLIEEAALSWWELGSVHKAIELTERLDKMLREKDPEAINSCDLASVENLWEMFGKPERAAELNEHIGDMEDLSMAAEKWIAIGNRKRAIKCVKAIESLAGKGNHNDKRYGFGFAAESWVKLGFPDRASRCARSLEEIGELHKAVEIYESIGRHTKARKLKELDDILRR